MGQGRPITKETLMEFDYMYKGHHFAVVENPDWGNWLAYVPDWDLGSTWILTASSQEEAVEFAHNFIKKYC